MKTSYFIDTGCQTIISSFLSGLKLSSDELKDLLGLCSGATPVMKLTETVNFYKNSPHYILFISYCFADDFVQFHKIMFTGFSLQKKYNPFIY